MTVLHVPSCCANLLRVKASQDSQNILWYKIGNILKYYVFGVATVEVLYLKNNLKFLFTNEYGEDVPT